MKKIINQAQPEGRSQPEIRPGDIWRDNHGSEITISEVSAARVVYYRHGYAKPCIASPERLRRDFIFNRAPHRSSPGLDRVMKATSCEERIRVMRSIIRERGQAK